MSIKHTIKWELVGKHNYITMIMRWNEDGILDLQTHGHTISRMLWTKI